MIKLGYILIAYLTFANAQKFPTDIKQCAYKDEKCLISTVEDLLRKQSKGIKELDIIPLDPLEIKSLSFKKIPGAFISVDLNLQNATLTGLSKSRVLKVTGFEQNATNMDIDLEVDVSEVIVTGMYDIEGKVQVLPISGKGECKGTFENVHLVAKASGTKNGDTLNIQTVTVDFQPQRVIYYFGNLFNGDKVLGDNMNAFLNENWEQVYEHLKPLVDEALAKILLEVIKAPFLKTPYSKMFLIQ